MSLFGSYSPSAVVDVAEKFISKMDERRLADDIAATQATMSLDGRKALVESILEAFRGRGESSDDVAEASQTSLEAMQSGDVHAVSALLAYVQQNTGLLKEAASLLIENDPQMVAHLPSTILAGISAKLAP